MADIVFLIDATGSMGPCIDALKANIETFIDFLSHGEGNHVSPVQDWRAKVVALSYSRKLWMARVEGMKKAAYPSV